MSDPWPSTCQRTAPFTLPITASRCSSAVFTIWARRTAFVGLARTARLTRSVRGQPDSPWHRRPSGQGGGARAYPWIAHRSGVPGRARRASPTSRACDSPRRTLGHLSWCRWHRDLLFMHPALAHGMFPNRSAKDRSTLIVNLQVPGRRAAERLGREALGIHPGSRAAQ